MLTIDDLAELEGDSERIHIDHGSDPDDPVCPDVLCWRVLRTKPKLCRMVGLADLGISRGDFYVRINRFAHPTRIPELVAHEVAEGALRMAGWAREDIEERADALGAMLLAPRRFYRRLIGKLGHRVHALARASLATQSLALLRLGEVTGRPVALVRRPAIVRGELFAWPDDLDRLRRAPVKGIHPIRVDDRWGLMAS